MTVATAFHFLHPLWLLALPLLLALVFGLAWRERRSGNWSSLVDADLLSALRLTEAKSKSSLWWLIALCWTLAVLALAGPTWQRRESAAFRTPAAWVIALDLSPSMNATDISPNRVTRARYAIDDLLSAAHDARVALVVFAGETHTVTPLTTDVATVRSLLPPLAPSIMPESGDKLAPALDDAARLLRNAAVPHGQVMVLTDGFSDPAQALSAAQRLHRQGAEVHVIGVGTESGAPLPSGKGAFVHDGNGRDVLTRLSPDTLKRVATAGDGDYVALGDLPTLIAKLNDAQTQSFNGTADNTQTAISTQLNDGFWLLPPLLLLGALLARRGWL